MITAIYARILLAALCCLLALAASASAECAWVLWERLASVSSGTASGTLMGTEHKIVAARSAEQDCRALVWPTVQRRTDIAGAPGPSGKKPNVTVEGDSVVILQYEGGLLSWAYTCLPDTVDPRGPKGTK